MVGESWLVVEVFILSILLLVRYSYVYGRKLIGRLRVLVTLGIQTTTKRLAATNFPMPAMSPTMTEGTISSWKLKEGEVSAYSNFLSFSTCG